MLERPEIRDDQIAACVQHDYGLRVSRITFLPLGADRDTAVFRVVADDETPYFLKLRGGVFDETSVALPRFLSDQGIAQIIAPLATKSGQLWANLGAVKTILYPFVAGRNGYEVDLSDRHWVEFGAALKRIHTAALPPALAGRIQQETYSPQWREIASTFLKRVEDDRFSDPISGRIGCVHHGQTR